MLKNLKKALNFELGMVRTPQMPVFGKLDEYTPLTREEVEYLNKKKRDKDTRISKKWG